jgi:23S rRNA (guanosine2251-2'-O)-methyltransferase
MQIVFGLHAVEAILRESPTNIISLSLVGGKHNPKLNLILELCKQHKINIELQQKSALDVLSKNGNHQGVVAKIIEPLKVSNNLEDIVNNMGQQAISTILVLDGITDSHNLGAIIRTAEGLGVAALVLPKDNSANPNNSIVHKISSGAVNYLPIVMVTNISRALDYLKDQQYWIVGTSLSKGASSLFDYQPVEKTVVVLGSEDKGMRRLVEESCDYLVTIPMQGKVQSLNVSVTAGIVLSHLCYLQQKQ